MAAQAEEALHPALAQPQVGHATGQQLNVGVHSLGRLVDSRGQLQVVLRRAGAGPAGVGVPFVPHVVQLGPALEVLHHEGGVPGKGSHGFGRRGLVATVAGMAVGQDEQRRHAGRDALVHQGVQLRRHAQAASGVFDPAPGDIDANGLGTQASRQRDGARQREVVDGQAQAPGERQLGRGGGQGGPLRQQGSGTGGAGQPFTTPHEHLR
ncbi:hypothetical protein DBR42_29890 [Pelomonas sp. HMWF004]|nr:hypothetical protein DBR42_29890 [Pelomonas sp. HMWF004]